MLSSQPSYLIISLDSSLGKSPTARFFLHHDIPSCSDLNRKTTQLKDLHRLQVQFHVWQKSSARFCFRRFISRFFWNPQSFTLAVAKMGCYRVAAIVALSSSVNALISPRHCLSISREPGISRSFVVPKNDEGTNIGFQDVQEEANAALEAVGWARPLNDGEMTSDDPFVQQIEAGIRKDYGVGLDDLLNPAKVRCQLLIADRKTIRSLQN